jgi:hypothetical protein
MRHGFVIAISLIAGIELTGCGGGALHATPTVSVQHPTAQLFLKVPAAGTTSIRRGRHYVSPATQSIDIATSLYGLPPTDARFNVSPTAPNCSGSTSGTTCTFTIVASAVGQNQFTISTYDQPLSSSGATQGNVLSTGSFSAPIASGTANVVKATLSGVPASATIVLSQPNPPVGTPATIPLSIAVYDADGYAIVGQYATAVSLEITSDPPASFGFSFNGISGPAMNLGSSNDTTGIALLYSGYDTIAATLSAVTWSNGQVTLGSTSFRPTPTYGSETPIATSLVGSDFTSTQPLTASNPTLWFTEPAKGLLASMVDGSSAITEIAMPSGGTPQHLTTDGYPNYNIGVSESNNTLAQVNGTNVVETPLAFSNAGVNGMWITDYSPPEYYLAEGARGAIAVVTGSGPSATQVEYADNVPGSAPAKVIDDGGVFFTDPGANAIGQLTSSHTFAWYPRPSGAAPQDIGVSEIVISVNYERAVLWFTEPGSSKLATFSTDTPASVTEYACSGVPIAMAVDTYGIVVLTQNGDLDVFTTDTGERSVYTPPSSSAGPIVNVFAAGYGKAVLVRSNGTSSSFQDFRYY